MAKQAKPPEKFFNETNETRAEKFGIVAADMIMQAAHLTFNASRGRRMVRVCVAELQKRVDEIQPKKADPVYKKKRYG